MEDSFEYFEGIICVLFLNMCALRKYAQINVFMYMYAYVHPYLYVDFL